MVLALSNEDEAKVSKYVEEMGSAVVQDILQALTFEAGNIKIKFK